MALNSKYIATSAPSCFLFIVCCRYSQFNCAFVIYLFVLFKFLLLTSSHLSRDENTSIFFTRRAVAGAVGVKLRLPCTRPMVSTSSPQPDNDTKRQRVPLEKAKVVNVSTHKPTMSPLH